MGQFFKLFNIRQDDIVIIHIVPHALYALLALEPVVHSAGQGHHFLLAGFHPQGHTPIRRGARGVGYDGIRKPSQMRAWYQLLVALVNGLMGGAGEKLL